MLLRIVARLLGSRQMLTLRSEVRLPTLIRDQASASFPVLRNGTLGRKTSDLDTFRGRQEPPWVSGSCNSALAQLEGTALDTSTPFPQEDKHEALTRHFSLPLNIPAVLAQEL